MPKCFSKETSLINATMMDLTSRDIEEFERLAKYYNDLLQDAAWSQLLDVQRCQALELSKTLGSYLGAGSIAALDDFHSIGGAALEHVLDAQDSLVKVQEAANTALGGYNFTDVYPTNFIQDALVEAEVAAHYHSPILGFEDNFLPLIDDFQSFASGQLGNLLEHSGRRNKPLF